jgi:hypothetical protein
MPPRSDVNRRRLGHGSKLEWSSSANHRSFSHRRPAEIDVNGEAAESFGFSLKRFSDSVLFVSG